MTKDMRIKALTEKKDAIIEKMEALVAGAVDENGEERAFTEEEQAAFDAYQKNAENLKKIKNSEVASKVFGGLSFIIIPTGRISVSIFFAIEANPFDTFSIFQLLQRVPCGNNPKFQSVFFIESAVFIVETSTLSLSTAKAPHQSIKTLDQKVSNNCFFAINAIVICSIAGIINGSKPVI